MMTTHTIALSAVSAVLLTTGTALAGGEGWTHDFAAAKEQATKENKSLLIDFTGSDWCGWCIKLREEVFDHDAFNDGVKDSFVLVELDFPRDKSILSEETIAQNTKLGELYAVQGYPTIMLTDADGGPFAKTGYRPGGPEAYVTHLNELLGARTARDAAFAKAEDQTGAEKAKTLSAALQAMELDDSLVMGLYGDVVAGIKKADPADASGFVKGMELNARFAEIEGQLSTLWQTKKTDEALKLANATLGENVFEGEQKQTIMLIKGLVLGEMKNIDEALSTLDAAEAIDPDGRLVRSIEFYRERFKESEAPAAAE